MATINDPGGGGGGGGGGGMNVSTVGNDLLEHLAGILILTSSTLSPASVDGGSEDGGGDGIDRGIPAHMSLIMTISCSLILVVGIIGNCLVPVVIWNNSDLRNSNNLFLLNLSLADILVLCVSMPTVLVEIHQADPEVWILGRIMCESPFFSFH